jgi:REP element-mobilizing transposase RayT
LPTEAIKKLVERREGLRAQPTRPGETLAERAIRENKVIFAMADRFLDHAVTGPVHLKDSRAAKIVEDSILFGAAERYDLFAWCVMANHVHVLLMPRWKLQKITQGIKGTTAYEINGVQNARGRIFWLDESYDHWARDEEEIHRIIRYIESNPVKAGLCARPEEWPWSSARFRRDWPVGGVYKGQKSLTGRR